MNLTNFSGAINPRWLWEMLAPRHCTVCGGHIGQAPTRMGFICDKCLDLMPLAPHSDVIYNSIMMNFEADEISISHFHALFSLSAGEGYMNLIYSLKYAGSRRIGVELGRCLGGLMQNRADTRYDGVIAVPIHHARLRERGFNQADAICEGLAASLGIPHLRRVIKRARYTTSQTRLTKNERKSNVSNIFTRCNAGPGIRNGVYLIVDDVLTTGSTINSAAGALLAAGARRVDAAVLAKA